MSAACICALMAHTQKRYVMYSNSWTWAKFLLHLEQTKSVSCATHPILPLKHCFVKTEMTSTVGICYNLVQLFVLAVLNSSSSCRQLIIITYLNDRCHLEQTYIVCTIVWWQLWNFIVRQVNFNSFLHPNEPPRRIFSYLARQVEPDLSNIWHF